MLLKLWATFLRAILSTAGVEKFFCNRLYASGVGRLFNSRRKMFQRIYIPIFQQRTRRFAFTF